MTLEQLRVFIAVAEREHMTKAAHALNMTQSAVSAAISTLEDQHNIKLFHRVGRGISLNNAGQIFLDEARAVVVRADSAVQALEDLSGLMRGKIRIVASQTIAGHWLPKILAIYQVRYPALEIDLAVGNTNQAAARVRDGRADLGIVEGMIDDPVLARWPLGEDRLMLVQSKKIDSNTKIDAKWLRSAWWILREQGSGTRSTFNDALKRFGVEPSELKISLVLPSNESVRTAVEAGAGVAALSAFVVAPAIAAGTINAVPLDLGTRQFYGLHHKEHYRSKAVDALLDLIKQYG